MASPANWNVIHKRETASTNLDAAKGSPWDVFTADCQTAGRGRLDHKWHSRPGVNLMMSAVLPVGDLPPDHVSTLPLAVGLALAEGLRALPGADKTRFALKWPNDLLAGGKKIAGILCERHGDIVVAGIGVNAGETDFPDELKSRAVSLVQLGVKSSVRDVRDAVLSSLAVVYAEWKKKGFAAIWPRISAVDALDGMYVEVNQTDDDQNPVKGICNGIARDGALLVGGTPIWAGEAHIVAFSPA